MASVAQSSVPHSLIKSNVTPPPKKKPQQKTSEQIENKTNPASLFPIAYVINSIDSIGWHLRPFATSCFSMNSLPKTPPHNKSDIPIILDNQSSLNMVAFVPKFLCSCEGLMGLWDVHLSLPNPYILHWDRYIIFHTLIGYAWKGRAAFSRSSRSNDGKR